MDGFEFLKWLFGAFLSVAVILIGSFRHLSAKIASANESRSDGDAALHSKVEKLREDVREKYVRREDLGVHLEPIKTALEDQRQYAKQMDEKLDRLIQRGN